MMSNDAVDAYTAVKATLKASFDEACNEVLRLRHEADMLKKQINDLNTEERETRERIVTLNLQEKRISAQESAANSDIDVNQAKLLLLRNSECIAATARTSLALRDESLIVNGAAIDSTMYVKDVCRINVARRVLDVGLCQVCSKALDGNIEDRRKELNRCADIIAATHNENK
eukprot:GHVU01162784.1.p1 GENE.GHVU01162784.1~~GHVU01162784.1.p1  ORF type:complete len:173 (+),score=8.78 GHVU01162784.1:1037-1555(+)